ncbi:caspase, EACC1-associated type [Nocardia xishanensis]
MRLPDSRLSRAVLMGTAEYEPNTGFSPLPAVARNLVGLADFLRTQTGLGHIVTTLDPQKPEAFYDSLTDAVAEAEDLLLFYYAGHGMAVNNELVLTYTGSHYDKVRYTTVPYSAIREDISRSGAAIKVVILDCCYSGKAHGPGALAGDRDGDFNEQAVIEGAYVLTATGTSQNFASASGPGGCTAFTGGLLEILRTGSERQEEYISLASLLPLLQSKLRGENHPLPRSSGRDTAAGLALARNPYWFAPRRKRFFRNKDTDLPPEDFTAVGVYDITGDASPRPLMSEHMKLIAAFDERFIFIDPDPVAVKAARERHRIFTSPGASWFDYDRELLSPGGGVWIRGEVINLDPEAKAALSISEDRDSFSSNELIKAILCAQVDVLVNGGLYTMVKGEGEVLDGHLGWRADVFVNGSEVRAGVIHEADNRIATPLGELEFAASSGEFVREPSITREMACEKDHGDNLRTLLHGSAEKSAQSVWCEQLCVEEARRKETTWRLAFDHQLRLAKFEGATAAKVFIRILPKLEHDHGAEDVREKLPSASEILRRIEWRRGLASQEIATLAIYVRDSIYRELSAADYSEDFFYPKLLQYFPVELAECSEMAVSGHASRHSIISSVIVDDILDFGGIDFCQRLYEQVRDSSIEVWRALEATLEIFGLRDIYHAVRSSAAPEKVRFELELALRQVVRRTSRWLLQNRPQPVAVSPEISRYRSRLIPLSDLAFRLYPAGLDASVADRITNAIDKGAPRELATQVFRRLDWTALLDIIEISESTGREEGQVAQIYFMLNSRLGIDHLLRAADLPQGDELWRELAHTASYDEIRALLRRLALDVVLGSVPEESPAEAVALWEALTLGRRAVRAGKLIDGLAESGLNNLAALSVAVRQLQTMINPVPFDAHPHR